MQPNTPQTTGPIGTPEPDSPQPVGSNQHQPATFSGYEPPTPPPRHDNLRMVISTLGLVLAAFTIAFVVMFFVFRSYQVEGPSMQPSLHNGDRLIIWKLPRSLARITGHPYIPNRGDVIVFVERGLVASDGSTKQLIKRVIGVPGDRVVIKDGVVKVYNKAHPSGFTPDTSMPYGKGLSLSVDPNESVNQTIGKNEVYAMGDNRGNSLDSRVFGPVDASDIVGKLVLRMFPIGDAKKF
jgi:signal peptidase I